MNLNYIDPVKIDQAPINPVSIALNIKYNNLIVIYYSSKS